MITPTRKLEAIIKEFSPKQLETLFDNIMAIQLTEGCSSACPDCGLQAKPGVRDIISFDFLEKVFTDFKGHIGTFFPYWASDPFDYDDGEHSYLDVHKLIEERLHMNPVVITNMPPGKEKDIWKLIFSGNKAFGVVEHTAGNLINAISMTDLNAYRLTKHLQELIPQLNEEQLVVPSQYVLRKCTNTSRLIKDGISHATTRRWVLRNVDQVLEALDESDSNNVYVNGNNPEAMIKKHVQMVTKPKGHTNFLEFYREHQRGPTQEEEEKIREQSQRYQERIDEIVPKQISLETGIGVKKEGNIYFVQLPNGHHLGKESSRVELNDVLNYFNYQHWKTVWRLNQPYFGVHIRDDRGKGMHTKKLGEKNINNLSEEGICCFHGVVLTPEGFFNQQTRKPTREYPHGYRFEKIKPDNFHVAKRKFVMYAKPVHVAKSFRYVSL